MFLMNEERYHYQVFKIVKKFYKPLISTNRLFLQKKNHDSLVENYLKIESQVEMKKFLQTQITALCTHPTCTQERPPENSYPSCQEGTSCYLELCLFAINNPYPNQTQIHHIFPKFLRNLPKYRKMGFNWITMEKDWNKVSLSYTLHIIIHLVHAVEWGFDQNLQGINLLISSFNQKRIKDPYYFEYFPLLEVFTHKIHDSFYTAVSIQNQDYKETQYQIFQKFYRLEQTWIHSKVQDIDGNFLKVTIPANATNSLNSLAVYLLNQLPLNATDRYNRITNDPESPKKPVDYFYRTSSLAYYLNGRNQYFYGFYLKNAYKYHKLIGVRSRANYPLSEKTFQVSVKRQRPQLQNFFGKKAWDKDSSYVIFNLEYPKFKPFKLGESKATTFNNIGGLVDKLINDLEELYPNDEKVKQLTNNRHIKKAGPKKNFKVNLANFIEIKTEILKGRRKKQQKRYGIKLGSKKKKVKIGTMGFDIKLCEKSLPP